MNLSAIAAALACVAMATSGCAQTVYSSRLLSSAKLATDSPEAVYALPKATIPVRLSVIGTVAALDVGQPVLEADTAHTYVLSHNVNVANSDTLKISLNESTGFLTSLKSTVTGEYDAVIRGLAKSASAITPESNVSGGDEVILFDVLVDPEEFADGTLQRRLRAAMDGHVASRRDDCADQEMRQTIAAERQLKSIAAAKRAKKEKELRQKIADDRRTCDDDVTRVARISVPALNFRIAINRTTAPAPDCEKGICYRPAAENAVTVVWNGREIQRAVRLPNGQDVRVIPLTRPFVADAWVTDIEFDNGSPKELTITRPSGAKEVVLLPFNITADAISALTSSLVVWKKEKITAETELINAEAAKITAAAALETARKGKSTPKEESEVQGKWYPLLISMTSNGLPRGGPGLGNSPEEPAPETPKPGAGAEPTEPSGPGGLENPGK